MKYHYAATARKTVQVPVKWDPLGNFPHLMIGKSLYLADDRVIKEV